MSKIFRFSGYYVENNPKNHSNNFKQYLLECLSVIKLSSKGSEIQQLHIEESEEFELDGEDKDNCDLALLTRHFKHENAWVEYDRPLPQKGQKYRHFKLGKIVEVVGISRHTETEEVSVVYEYEGKIWNRPLDMFMSEVDREKYPDVAQKYRFELVEEI